MILRYDTFSWHLTQVYKILSVSNFKNPQLFYFGLQRFDYFLLCLCKDHGFEVANHDFFTPCIPICRIRKINGDFSIFRKLLYARKKVHKRLNAMLNFLYKINKIRIVNKNITDEISLTDYATNPVTIDKYVPMHS